MDLGEIIEALEYVEKLWNTERQKMRSKIVSLELDVSDLQKKLDAASDKKPVNDAVHKALEPVYQELELWFKKYEEDK